MHCLCDRLNPHVSELTIVEKLACCRFRVRAENEAGRSLWSPLGEGRTAAVAPASCSAPVVLGTSQTSLTVRWQASDGVAPGPCAGCVPGPAIVAVNPSASWLGVPAACLFLQGPEDDGGSPVLYYQLEARPKCPAARRGRPDEWVVAYQVRSRVDRAALQIAQVLEGVLGMAL
jgi:hypothetical protein